MVFGIGIDILETARMAKQLASRESGLKEKLFTQPEIVYCESKRYKHRHYAARFAAKEAFLKAVGTGLRQGLAWSDIEVIHDALGKPSLKLSGQAMTLLQKQPISRIHLSLSHVKDTAVAVVILEQAEEAPCRT